MLVHDYIWILKALSQNKRFRIAVLRHVKIPRILSSAIAPLLRNQTPKSPRFSAATRIRNLKMNIHVSPQVAMEANGGNYLKAILNKKNTWHLKWWLNITVTASEKHCPVNQSLTLLPEKSCTCTIPPDKRPQPWSSHHRPFAFARFEKKDPLKFIHGDIHCLTNLHQNKRPLQESKKLQVPNLLKICKIPLLQICRLRRRL